MGGTVVLDTDTLSELSRGNTAIVTRARAYLAEFGRLTITAVTVFERMRGYHIAISSGKPYELQLRAFRALVASCIVLPLDEDAATSAARIWSACSRKQRQQLGDILIAGVAVSRQATLATRNRRDFERIARAAGVTLDLVDWATTTRRV